MTAVRKLLMGLGIKFLKAHLDPFVPDWKYVYTELKLPLDSFEAFMEDFKSHFNYSEFQRHLYYYITTRSFDWPYKRATVYSHGVKQVAFLEAVKKSMNMALSDGWRNFQERRFDAGQKLYKETWERLRTYWAPIIKPLLEKLPDQGNLLKDLVSDLDCLLANETTVLRERIGYI